MRKKWWTDHKNYDLDKVVYKDETAFKTGKTKTKRGMKKTRKALHHEESIQKSKLLMSYLQKSKCSLKLFMQNMDAEFYVKILTEKFNEMSRIGGKNSGVTIW